MKQVIDLSRGDMFVLDGRAYRILSVNGDNAIVVNVAFKMDDAWHPMYNGHEENCNPYATVQKVKLEFTGVLDAYT